jgi:hypothetical protein
MDQPNPDECPEKPAAVEIGIDPEAAEPRGARLLNLVFGALIVGLLTLALLVLLLHFVSYANAKTFFDSYVAVHVAQGHRASYLKEEQLKDLLGRLPLAAVVFGICGVTLSLFKGTLTAFLLAIPSEWKGLRQSLRDQFPGGTEIVLEISAVFGVFAIGIFLRLWHLGRPVRYDEAWTYMEFASRPLVRALSDYRAPNNHLLNTVLVHFSTQLFGNTTFGLRFPALAAGCFAIPMSWFATRAFYGRLAGILAAGCVAALPTFIEFSINARGYALQWLFILAVMVFAMMLHENPSLRTGWIGLVIAAVGGMYCIPTMLVPVGGVFLWMLASRLVDGKPIDLVGLVRKLSLASLAIGLLSILLYVPPLIVAGPDALMSRGMVTWQQQGDFRSGFGHLGQCAWVQWTEGVPMGALWILLGGLVVGLLFHRRVCEHRVPMTIALCLSAAIVARASHVFAFPRVWSYLLLSAVMTASAGLSLVLTLLGGRSRVRRVVLAGVASAALAVFVGAGVIKQRALLTSNETGTIIDADQIVRFLSSELRPGDSLMGNAIIEYELLRRSPKLFDSLAKPEEPARVVAVVVKRTGNTELCRTEELVALQTAQDTADPSTLAPQVDLHAYTPPEVRAKFLTSTVYSLERRRRTE